MRTLLKLDGVTAFYGASQALFGVDLDVGEGEVVALMGRNGMGKTTTVRTISSLLRPREGAITFAGACASHGSGGHCAAALRRAGLSAWSSHQPACGPAQTSSPR